MAGFGEEDTVYDLWKVALWIYWLCPLTDCAGRSERGLQPSNSERKG